VILLYLRSISAQGSTGDARNAQLQGEGVLGLRVVPFNYWTLIETAELVVSAELLLSVAVTVNV
jgi:hypothetical protein